MAVAGSIRALQSRWCVRAGLLGTAATAAYTLTGRRPPLASQASPRSLAVAAALNAPQRAAAPTSLVSWRARFVARRRLRRARGAGGCVWAAAGVHWVPVAVWLFVLDGHERYAGPPAHPWGWRGWREGQGGGMAGKRRGREQGGRRGGGDASRGTQASDEDEGGGHVTRVTRLPFRQAPRSAHSRRVRTGPVSSRSAPAPGRAAAANAHQASVRHASWARPDHCD